jgi:hypothetical protein
MAVDTDLLRAYVDGLVATTDAGVTATAPTDASTPLHANFKQVGALTEDGVTESSSQDVTDVFIWQNAALGRRIRGQFTRTYSFAAAETNLVVAGIHWAGSTITQTAEGLSIAEKPPAADVRQWVLHGIDGTRAQRVYLPRAEVTERGDVVWSSGAITVYEWVLTAYVDDAGFTHRRRHRPADRLVRGRTRPGRQTGRIAGGVRRQPADRRSDPPFRPGADPASEQAAGVDVG